MADGSLEAGLMEKLDLGTLTDGLALPGAQPRRSGASSDEAPDSRHAHPA